MKYPKTFLRGLITKGSVTEERYVTSEAFQFQDFRAQRSDNYNELSINWEDSDEAVDVLLNQKKEGTDEPQFKVGFVRIPLLKVRSLLKAHVKDQSFAYERKPVDGNSYHGNLLADAKLSKSITKNLQHSLATLAAASEIYLRSDAEVPYLKDKKKKMPKVSIIVPVYKAEKYLGRCIESLLNQTFSDFELVLVDDGSPDNSGVVCDEYAAKDSRIRVVHKENGGVSSARNKGLDVANGEWVVFVDSDDWVENSYLSDFFKHKVSTTSIVLQGMFFDYETYSKQIDFDDILINESNFVEKMIEYHLIHYGGPVCKLYNNSIIQKNEIRFPLDYSYGEDTVFFYKYLIFVSEIRLINRVNYHYIQNCSESLMKRLHPFDQHKKYICDGVKYLEVVAASHKDASNFILRDFIDYMFPLMVRSCLNMYRMGCTSKETYDNIITAKLTYGKLLDNYSVGIEGYYRRILFDLPPSALQLLLFCIYKIRG